MPARRCGGLGSAGGSYEAFVRAAGLVQSRSFHVNAENWLTGQCTEGGTPAAGMAGKQVFIRVCLPCIFIVLAARMHALPLRQ